MSTYPADVKGKSRADHVDGAYVRHQAGSGYTPEGSFDSHQASYSELRPRNQIEAMSPYSSAPTPYDLEFSSLWHPENYTASCSYTTYTTSTSLFPSPDEAEDMRALAWQDNIDRLVADSEKDSFVPSETSEIQQTLPKSRIPHELTCQAYGDAQWDWERLFGKAKKPKKQERSKEEVAEITKTNDQAAKRRMMMYLSHLTYQTEGSVGMA